MTGGARVAAAEGGGRRSGVAVGRCWAKSVSGLRAQNKKEGGMRAGLGCGAELENRDGLKGENGEWREMEKGFFSFFSLEINQLNSKMNLNSSNHKQCSSMNAIHIKPQI
jgi:hypothetical protein